MKLRVAMLYGGKSVEHEVSVISGIQALRNMDTEKYEAIPLYMTKNNEMYIGEDIGRIEAYTDIPALLARSTRVVMMNENGQLKLHAWPAKKWGKNTVVDIDLVFPVVHGTNVEDGALQGYLKTLGVPFVGCDVCASAVGMDKYISKMILKEAGVPLLPALLFGLRDYADADKMIQRIEETFGYPVIVKPVNLGSSVGIGVAKDKIELSAALDEAYRYAGRVMVEHAVSRLREINCAVLGDENEAEASECEEPLHSKDILSYEDKYERGAKGSAKGMASVSRQIPAKLSQEKREEVRSLAVRAFQALGCSGVARIDFLIDEEDGRLYFNEINTIPGSLSFYLWEPLGMPYSRLLDRMIEIALRRSRAEENISFSFTTNILAGASLGGSKGSKV